MINKTDDALQTINDFLRTITDRISPNVILTVAIINGFLIGLATTGYMGEQSLSVRSLSFFLILWQLVIICIFSSRYIDLTTSYLNKFGMCIAIGYFWQWQIFGMIASNETNPVIFPPIENGFAGMLLGYFSILFLFGYCFRNNKRSTEKKIYSLKDKDAA